MSKMNEKEIREKLEKEYRTIDQLKELTCDYIRRITLFYSDIKKGIEDENMVMKLDEFFPNQEITIETEIQKIKHMQRVIDVTVEMIREKTNAKNKEEVEE